MSCWKYICTGLLLVVIGWTRLSAQADPTEASGVVILVNATDASSVELGEYYAARRGIPPENIIALELSSAETISLREYVDTIHNPLLHVLLEKGWIDGVKSSEPDGLGREGMAVALHSIRYLVTVRGVPLRISNAPELLNSMEQQLPPQIAYNRAAVDSELALLAGAVNLPMAGFVSNPLFNQAFNGGTGTGRVIRVSRLDGPSFAAVAKLIDRSLEAEAKGLVGRAYFDLGGPHGKGDTWIEDAGTAAVGAYFDTDFERSKRVLDYVDRLDAPAIYMGWYRSHAYGPWRAARGSVPAGAIGFHLHSFSATSVRNVKQGWLAAFVAQGYCATVGNVFEPYLEYTHRPDLLLQHLLQGHSWGEAVAYSLPVLSWMGVAIGDPLYRPFKVGLDAQLQGGVAPAFAPYLILRQLNRLKAERGDEAALEYARSQFSQNPSLVLAYRLAQLYDERGESTAAVDALRIVRYLSVFAADEWVVASRVADFLNEKEQPDLALNIYQSLLGQLDLDPALRLQLLKQGSAIAQAAGSGLLASEWADELLRLTPPPAQK
ncbi:MAG: hypothetical protein ACI81V_000745 [Lentimonas sp.]|jgi:uncharacterized protein (TIGR03790 family)